MKILLAVIAALFLIGCEGEGFDNVIDNSAPVAQEPHARPMDNVEVGG